MNYLKQYFINQANILDCEFCGSSPTRHPIDTGENREFLLKKFFDEHLPFCAKAFTGGKILDSSGQQSGQVDLIIHNETTPRFHHLNRTLYMAEGVYATLEVKPELTIPVICGNEKTKSIFEYCSSIKKLFKKFGEGSLALAPGSDNPSGKVYFGVFAYKSKLNAENVIECLDKYYKSNSTDINSKINFICVNKNYTIVLNKGEWRIKSQNGTDQAIPNNKYFVLQKDDFSLWAMFMLILRQIDLLIRVIPDHLAYIRDNNNRQS